MKPIKHILQDIESTRFSPGPFLFLVNSTFSEICTVSSPCFPDQHAPSSFTVWTHKQTGFPSIQSSSLKVLHLKRWLGGFGKKRYVLNGDSQHNLYKTTTICRNYVKYENKQNPRRIDLNSIYSELTGNTKHILSQQAGTPKLFAIEIWRHHSHLDHHHCEHVSAKMLPIWASHNDSPAPELQKLSLYVAGNVSNS